jgi:hypothetical protein
MIFGSLMLNIIDSPQKTQMMKQVLLFVFVLVISFTAHSQIEFGVKAGLSSYDLAKDGLIANNGTQNIEWNISKAGYGHHFGIYTRLSMLGLYLEPALLFNSNTVTYDIKRYGESGVFNTIKSEKYNHMDIPVMAGFRVGKLRFQGGVVGHLFINSISDAVDIKGYEQRFKGATYGWQAGTGLDLWRLRFDLAYEGNLDKFGDHITIGGYNYAFSKAPSRLLLTMGFKF